MNSFTLSLAHSRTGGKHYQDGNNSCQHDLCLARSSRLTFAQSSFSFLPMSLLFPSRGSPREAAGLDPRSESWKAHPAEGVRLVSFSRLSSTNGNTSQPHVNRERMYQVSHRLLSPPQESCMSHTVNQTSPLQRHLTWSYQGYHMLSWKQQVACPVGELPLELEVTAKVKDSRKHTAGCWVQGPPSPRVWVWNALEGEVIVQATSWGNRTSLFRVSTPAAGESMQRGGEGGLRANSSGAFRD